MKWSISTVVSVVGLASILVGAAGSFAVAAYRIAQLEKKVDQQTLIIESQQRSMIELITALRVKEIIK